MLMPMAHSAKFPSDMEQLLDCSLRANVSDGIVLAFYLSSHPQHSLAQADFQLDGVEFSSLPSELHLGEHDVVYTSIPYLSLCLSNLFGSDTSRRMPTRGVRPYPAPHM